MSENKQKAVERIRREELRGHAFYPPREQLEQVPELYATDGVEAPDKIVWLHYFVGGCDWYITEIDLPWRHNPESDNTRFLAFGYAKGLGGFDGGEWGYINLPELEEIEVTGIINFHQPDGSVVTRRFPAVVERDLYWEPKPWRDCGVVAYLDSSDDDTRIAATEALESEVWPC